MADARPVGKLGMTRFDRHEVRLKLSNYIPKWPPLPKRLGHAENWPASWWGMGGNQTHSDCVLAGAAHETKLWHAATGRPVPAFSDGTVINQYLAFTGGKDEGMDPVLVAQWRQLTGIMDDTAQVHKIKAYASVDTLQELAYAVYFFGACGIGCALPKGAEDDFTAHRPWTNTRNPRDFNRGHYMPVVGRNSKGMWLLSTWSDLQAASDAWVRTYWVGGLCYFSDDWLDARGLSPEQFNEDQLNKDLADLGR